MVPVIAWWIFHQQLSKGCYGLVGIQIECAWNEHLVWILHSENSFKIFCDRIGILLELLKVLEKWHSKQFQNDTRDEHFLFIANLLDEILLIIILMVISLRTNEVEHFSICSLMSSFFILILVFSIYIKYILVYCICCK